METPVSYFLYSKTHGYYLGKEHGFQVCCDLEQQVPLWQLRDHAEIVADSYDIPDVEILPLNTSASSIRLGDTLMAGMKREDFAGLI